MFVEGSLGGVRDNHRRSFVVAEPPSVGAHRTPYDSLRFSLRASWGNLGKTIGCFCFRRGSPKVGVHLENHTVLFGFANGFLGWPGEQA